MRAPGPRALGESWNAAWFLKVVGDKPLVSEEGKERCSGCHITPATTGVKRAFLLSYPLAWAAARPIQAVGPRAGGGARLQGPRAALLPLLGARARVQHVGRTLQDGPSYKGVACGALRGCEGVSPSGMGRVRVRGVRCVAVEDRGGAEEVEETL